MDQRVEGGISHGRSTSGRKIGLRRRMLQRLRVEGGISHGMSTSGRKLGLRRRMLQRPESRGWYQPWHVNIWQEDGFEKKDATESEERTLKEEKVDKVLVDAGEEATLCSECLEGFKLVYSEE